MSDIDTTLTVLMNSGAGNLPILDFLMIWTSAIGVPILVAAVALQWWVPPSDRRIRHVLVAAGLSFFIGLGFNQLVLRFVQRIRPYDAHITHLIVDRSVDFSFPSDHATASFAIAAAFLLHRLPKRGFIFFAVAVLLAMSRVYVGTHYVSDVLGGAVTGIVAAVLVRVAYREGSKLDCLVTDLL